MSYGQPIGQPAFGRPLNGPVYGGDFGSQVGVFRQTEAYGGGEIVNDYGYTTHFVQSNGVVRDLNGLMTHTFEAGNVLRRFGERIEPKFTPVELRPFEPATNLKPDYRKYFRALNASDDD